MSTTYVVVSTSEAEPIREGFPTRAEAERRAAECQTAADAGETVAVAEMPSEEYAEFERCGNRSATFSRAELTALGVI
jgi:predicted regulator of Ras-like GTPase activity (Roadblock/LC7/MglB family)